MAYWDPVSVWEDLDGGPPTDGSGTYAGIEHRFVFLRSHGDGHRESLAWWPWRRHGTPTWWYRFFLFFIFRVFFFSDGHVDACCLPSRRRGCGRVLGPFTTRLLTGTAGYFYATPYRDGMLHAGGVDGFLFGHVVFFVSMGATHSPAEDVDGTSFTAPTRSISSGGGGGALFCLDAEGGGGGCEGWSWCWWCWVLAFGFDGWLHGMECGCVGVDVSKKVGAGV